MSSWGLRLSVGQVGSSRQQQAGAERREGGRVQRMARRPGNCGRGHRRLPLPPAAEEEARIKARLSARRGLSAEDMALLRQQQALAEEMDRAAQA